MKDTRRKILDTAARVAREQGVQKVTLEAVAEACGLTRGGVLYHFPNKLALLQGIVDDVIVRHEQMLQVLTEKVPHATILDQMLYTTHRQLLVANPNLSLAILGAAVENPEVMAEARLRINAGLDEMRTSMADPIRAQVVWLAGEGLHYHELVGLASFDELSRQQIEAEIRRMAAALRPPARAG